VHYRRCGQGQPLLMIHQSPRSSGEYSALMQAWGAHFTCIAPDSPGFGQSTPLPGEPSIDDFADAIVATMDALGLERCPAYGFHSGGIILVTALKRHPHRFSGLAVGGYAIWTPHEMAVFGEHYLPPFQPSPYGEHLVWAWNRILEQSWFFPWFDVREPTRLPAPHADVARTDEAVRELLDAGDAYRAGYRAVLRAPRDIPPADALVPPVQIAAYDADPLQAHIDRLGDLPAGWRAEKVRTPADLERVSLAWLRALPPVPDATPNARSDAGFTHVTTAHFSGLVHWRGNAGDVATIPAPGRAISLFAGAGIDPPGHGLSDDWPGPAPTDRAAWDEVLAAVQRQRGFAGIAFEPHTPGDAASLYPDLTPDRFGSHLVRAWAVVRAGHFFRPWHSTATPTPFDPAEIAPDRLAAKHLALLQARSARAYHAAFAEGQENR
ncbi:MAG: alpha/beta fold hydrolase, partial [Sandarakinorhabdus sp.]|nr:alpha/beta fold hydrolase [Sandarakinorhabdus sp.]